MMMATLLFAKEFTGIPASTANCENHDSYRLRIAGSWELEEQPHTDEIEFSVMDGVTSLRMSYEQDVPRFTRLRSSRGTR